MLKGKAIDRICCLALVVMLALTAAVWTGKAASGRQKRIDVGYEDLFDAGVVHTIDIEIDDWDSLIANASQEEYASCTVTIDGEKISNVGIRAKGNTSLSSVATLGSEKYSFKIEFDHFVKGRLYNGLDKLSLNNLIYDATMMKDYLAYTLMGRMDVPSPLCSYAQITVNGEAWGLYLAVEGVEDGFMERNNMTEGELYKPDSLSFGGGRGNGQDFDFEQFRVKDDDESEDASEAAGDTAQAEEAALEGEEAETAAQAPSGGFPGQLPEGMSFPERMSLPEGFTPPGSSDGEGGSTSSRPGFGGFNFGIGSSDVKLTYTDDNPDSYSNIFDNAKTDVGKKDKARLIEALRKLNAGEDIGETVYTDEVIRYLAVHDFLQNSDSYTGMMVHNYYLYEQDGQLAIIPWDYNLAFGGMSGTDGTSLVNSPIDSPVDTGSTSERPLIAWIFTDEDATAQYHEIYSQFVADYIESGWLESEIARVAEMIRPYVESDGNSFYTAEEFDAAVDALQSYCTLRAESIRGQLDGTIPSTSEAQREDSAALVDASALDVSSMGSMNAGGGGGFGPSGDSGGGQGQQMPGAFPFGNGQPSGSFPGMPSGGGTEAAPEGGDSAVEAPAESASPDAAVEAPVESISPGTTGEAPAESASPETSGESATGTGAEGEAAPQAMPGGMNFPSGFTPPGEAQSSTAASMSWPELGIYAMILLLAVALALKMPGHNR